MSNVNADTKIPVGYTKAAQALLGQLANDVMDKQVVNTDMKVRHILSKGLEVKTIMTTFPQTLPLTGCNMRNVSFLGHQPLD